MTTTTSTTSANSTASTLISALGAGSGIDMASLASELATAQFATKIDRLAAKSETLDAQISAASNLKSMLLSLSTSLGSRIRIGDLSPQPSLDNASVASASLSGGVVPSGTYSVEVEQLAKGQILASTAFGAPSDPAGAGTITIRFGTVDGATFTPDAEASSADIAIPSGATLADVASAINAADTGVTAYVSQTVDGAKLVLKGAEGADNGFVLDVTEDAGEPGLSALAWQPASGGGTLLQQSQDALLKIDGLSIASPENRLTDAVPGVTLDLSGTNLGAPTTLRFSDPSDTITGAMQDLTAALNEIAAELQAAADPKTGDLARDPGARALRRSFSSLAGTVIMQTSAEDEPRTLADLGLKTNRDGTFSLDEARLAETLSRDPDGVAAMFTTGLYGIYATIDGISREAATTGNPGSLGGSIARYNETLLKVTEDQQELVEKQEALRTRLVTRFAASETRIAASQSTLAFLQGQIAAWNGGE